MRVDQEAEKSLLYSEEFGIDLSQDTDKEAFTTTTTNMSNISKLSEKPQQRI
jgi:hypothetical protein